MNKETLRQYLDIKAEISELRHERQRLLDSLGAPPSAAADGFRKGKKPVSDPTAAVAVQLAFLQTLIDEKLAQCIEQHTEIENAIGRLPSRERRILRARYIDGLSWPRVTERIYGKRGDYFERYDSYLRQVHRHHGIGLSRIS